jgi:hypothetical protein
MLPPLFWQPKDLNLQRNPHLCSRAKSVMLFPRAACTHPMDEVLESDVQAQGGVPRPRALSRKDPLNRQSVCP